MKSERVSLLALGCILAVRPLSGQAQQILCGQTINSSLSAAGQTNVYTFSAGAGEVVSILALGQTLNATAEVYSPAGVRMVTCTNNFTGPISLTSAGTYTMRVHADNSNSTGAYGISLSFLTGQCGTPLVWGPPITNNITSLAEVESFTFSAQAGETVTVNASGGNFTTAAFVSDPAGTILANWVNGQTSIALTNSGTYTVGVYSFFAAGVGTYSASMAITKLTAASFRLAIGATNGAAVVTIWGQAGRTTTLQYTPELSAGEWLTVTNFALPWSPYRFVDWSSAAAPKRFYQTVQ